VKVITNNKIRKVTSVIKRLVKEMYTGGKRGTGRPKKRWSDVIESDMKRAGVKVLTMRGIDLSGKIERFVFKFLI